MSLRAPRAILALQRSSTVCPCRIIVGRRFPPFRALHSSPKPRSQPQNPLAGPEDSFHDSSKLSPESKPEDAESERREAAAPSSTAEDAHARPAEANSSGTVEAEDGRSDSDHARSKENSPYGSARKRATRSARRPRDTYTTALPRFFFERNVTVHTELLAQQVVAESSVYPGKVTLCSNANSYTSTPSLYGIDRHVMREIVHLTRAGLDCASASNSKSAFTGRPHLVLQSPEAGGNLFLETVVRATATELEADLVTVNAQDIAEIACDNAAEFSSSLATSARTLGYETHIVEPPSDAHDNADGFEAFFDDGEDESSNSRAKPISLPFPKVKAKGAGPVKIATLPIGDILKSVKALGPASPSQGGPPAMIVSRPSEGRPTSPAAADADRATAIIDTILLAPQMKDARQQAIAIRDDEKRQEIFEAGIEQAIQKGKPNDLIVTVQDYLELCSTSSGSAVINLLHKAVDERRANGQRIIIVGTSSSEDLMPPMTQEGFRNAQTEPGQPYQVVLTPCTNAEPGFEENEQQRTAHINLRHVQDMLRRTAPNADIVPKASWHPWDFEASGPAPMELGESIWPLEYVQRLSSLALGWRLSSEASSPITALDIRNAMLLAKHSDDSKCEWLDEHNEKQAAQSGAEDAGEDPGKALDERIKRLRKTCNKYEKKLLNGVVDAQSVRTTFDDVRAAPRTIEALKDLTTLSLLRPDAFTYGVLATDKIPGLLLYGPPGTGKTLLAKAVAKESGAAMLEVAGSDVYDMYVGESEKNIRAIFSLARKLSPCVVFIDEADAIFGSRSGSRNRTAHRDLINQFLREWDGMNDLSAFIMVATNRPFDLDDAVLRRLPRRLLVDLPTEKDREAILGIHLKQETLHSDVSLQHLAARTPFYSGSDLKNLSVAAALACVREEVSAATATSGADASKIDPARNYEEENDSMPSYSVDHACNVGTLWLEGQTRELSRAMRALQALDSSRRDSHTQERTSILARLTNGMQHTASQVPTLLKTFSRELHERSADVDTVSSPETVVEGETRLVPNEKEGATPPPRICPAKRVLTAAHFEKALAEISASISEDMSSLAAIRKFDEKYGDRRGRRKKLEGWGFGTKSDGDRKVERAEHGRVRSDERLLVE